MSQEQPHRPEPNDQSTQHESNKYDNVSNELGSRSLTSKEAAMMKTTENHALGTTQKSGPGVTIGEALEATAMTRAGDKAVDMSDAAAIQAAEMRATKKNESEAGGVGAIAQSAATKNSRALPYMEKTTLSDVVSDAREKLASDKMVTKEDAEGVIGAEIRNKKDMITTPGGVAASVAAAATLNQNK
ncbi:hypothetical protein Lal_00047715 [Lupinus albus]|uniref:Putative Seed maturation protein n=1 Tax=Lupinus albus TaxID=3870 RepID=A0A6A4QVN4_LUPAL|nr:putative Seed maturation protein [Lupinus albus]KAF1879043.1 hypothetical protein Lal_00047715 [Lupinus albus]